MQVRDAMKGEVLTVTPARTLAEAAQHMHERGLSAALIIDPEQPGPGVVTQRDLLRALGEGTDPARERVEDHLTAGAKFAAPDWSLDQAAEAMVRGGFRHLAVIEGEDPVGVLAM
ncbi:MAG TPA: CBS domain-containing protein, partial [Thermoleophilaceae bacterium]|nr:CBS domain-containing protein [Thermoleophilaceae bacterium]